MVLPSLETAGNAGRGLVPSLPLWRRRGVARSAALVGLVAGVWVVAAIDTPVRAPFIVFFLFTVPAIAAARSWGGASWPVKTVVALAASAIVNTLLAMVMLVTGLWSPIAGILVVTVACGGLLVRNRPAPAEPASGRCPPAPWSHSLSIDVVHPSELDDSARDRWRVIQRAAPGLDNPFLSPEFTVAVGRFRPDARVAILSDSTGMAGFFPFERRLSGVGLPIAAGLTDCQGLVHVPGTEIDPKALLRACRLAVFEFDHLVAGQPFFEPFTTHRAASPVMDLGDGYESYQAQLRANSPKFLKTTLYKARKLGRDAGELRFAYDVRDHGELHRLMAWKSEQYRRTGRTDRFARPWIVRLADHLLDLDGDGFSAAFSMLYAGEAAVAGHFGLRTERVLVGWFPSYDTRYSRYSPGLAMHLRLAEAAAAAGIQYIDMGKGTREYKDALKSRELTVGEGRVTRPSPVTLAHWATTAPVQGVRRLVLTHPPLLRAANRVLGYYGRLTKAARPGT